MTKITLRELLSNVTRLDDDESTDLKSDESTDLKSDESNSNDTADELDLGDLGASDEPSTEDGTELDHVAASASDDPDKQGHIRSVPGARLVYKRQIDDGSYEELWIYNTQNFRQGMDVKRAILSGTDVKSSDTESKDQTQQVDVWSIGNAQMIRISGLPN